MIRARAIKTLDRANMDIDVIKLIVEITVLPCIGLISATVVAIVGAWMTFQFSKSLEKYKRDLTVEPSKTQITSNSVKPTNDDKQLNNDNASFADWIAKVMFRGTAAFINLIAFVFGTLGLFIIIRPFGTTFIHNRINELIRVPFFHQIYYEITQFFPIELLTGLCLLGVSIIGGSLASLLTGMTIDVLSWIFDLKQ